MEIRKDRKWIYKDLFYSWLGSIDPQWDYGDIRNNERVKKTEILKGKVKVHNNKNANGEDKKKKKINKNKNGQK